MGEHSFSGLCSFAGMESYKINCELCGEEIDRSHIDMVEHAFYNHAGVSIEKLLPMALNPGGMYGFGQRVGDMIKQRLFGSVAEPEVIEAEIVDKKKEIQGYLEEGKAKR